jgi:hypothetical protein
VRRIVLLNLLAVTAAAMVLAPFASGSGDSKGPPCSNIINGGTRAIDGYVAPEGSSIATFDFSMILAAPACRQMTYTFYVSTDGGLTFTALAGAANGTTVTMPQQTYVASSPSSLPGSVCVYATSTKSGDSDVADRAPDSGCLSYVLNEAPANSSFT